MYHAVCRAEFRPFNRSYSQLTFFIFLIEYLVYIIRDDVRPFVVRDFFVEVASKGFFCFEISFCPVKRGNRAGSSRNESDYSRRGTQISFPLLESRSCENFGLAHLSML